MIISTILRIVSTAFLALTMAIATSANAASMFNVTDLGSNYTLQQDSSEAVHSVTSGDGSQTYAFEKSPVTQINESPDNQRDINTQNYHTTYLLENGTFKTGYSWGNVSGSGSLYVPANFYILGDWGTRGNAFGGPLPVSDLNSQGEIVGTSNANYRGTFAAFSAPDGSEHISADGKSLASNNLNDFIASDLGVHLDSAVKVDDMGRIIASGMLDGKLEDFLLTPDGLSSTPIPAPEPTTLVVLAVGITALFVRSVHQRRR